VGGWTGYFRYGTLPQAPLAYPMTPCVEPLVIGESPPGSYVEITEWPWWGSRMICMATSAKILTNDASHEMRIVS
jgi:hypothetical protein